MTKSPPRSTRVAKDLLEAIASGGLRPGDPIDLPELCRRHRVSRTVVREALAELEGKGLVLARPGIGTEVADESSWSLLDPALLGELARVSGNDRLYAEARVLRRAVEPVMAAYAARSASRTERSAILDALRRIAGAVGAQDRASLPVLDELFYEAIGVACGNRLLRSIDRSLSAVRSGQCRLLRHLEIHDPGSLRSKHNLLTLQTGLALAIVRSEPVAAASWSLELASVFVARPTALDESVVATGAGVSQAGAVSPWGKAPDNASPRHKELGATPPDAGVDWPPTVTMRFESDDTDGPAVGMEEPPTSQPMTLRIPILRGLVGRRTGRSVAVPHPDS